MTWEMAASSNNNNPEPAGGASSPPGTDWTQGRRPAKTKSPTKKTKNGNGGNGHTMDDRDVSRQFIDAMERLGLIRPKQLIADGKFHRCDLTTRNGKKDGSYVLHMDGGIPTGYIHNWQTGEEGYWQLNVGRKLTQSERRDLERKRADAEKKREEDQARAQAEAQKLWNAAPPCPDDQVYLRKRASKPTESDCLGSPVAPSSYPSRSTGR